MTRLPLRGRLVTPKILKRVSLLSKSPTVSTSPERFPLLRLGRNSPPSLYVGLCELPTPRRKLVLLPYVRGDDRCLVLLQKFPLFLRDW